MRAAYWWIDRWRQSKAYAEMTAEEQGLYFNLCLDVFARDGEPIPDDDRVLAKASGDHEAWGRRREKVLKWMVRVEGGWTNKTALEVLGESKRRSEKQSEYRKRLGNTTGNTDRNNQRPQDQDQDPLSGSGSNAPPAPPPSAAGAWSKRAALEYAASVGKPALTRDAQNRIGRWVRGGTAAHVRKLIDQGDHLPRLPL